MNWLERKAAGFAWNRMEAGMPFLKRWLPVLGTALVAGGVIARAWGREDIAKAIDVVGSVTGASGAAGVTPTEIGAAVVAVTGVVLKVISQVNKARQA